jgi:hypothetical protein
VAVVRELLPKVKNIRCKNVKGRDALYHASNKHLRKKESDYKKITQMIEKELEKRAQL